MTTSPPALHDSPTVLLATLFAARRSGDRCLVRLMLDRLAALGIRVSFAESLPPRNRTSALRRVAD